MEILFFSSYYYPYISGLTTLPRQILSHLSKKKSVNITVLTFKHSNDLSDSSKDAKVTILRMPFNFRLSKGFISLSSVNYFFKHVKKSDTLILNIPNFEAWPLALLAKIYRKKIISIFHCKVKLNNHPFSGIINLFLNTSVTTQLLLSDKIIAFSSDYVESLNLSDKIKNKIEIVKPPVEKLQIDKSYTSRLQTKKENNIWIGFAGRISHEKGLHTLIKAVSELSIKPTPILVFAGPYGTRVAGETNYYQHILSQLNKLKLKHLFLGHLKKSELGAFYKAIDVLILPSINQTEAFGIVQVEAMKLGTPVIASNMPGVRDSINLTKMGLLFKPNDKNNLVSAIESFMLEKSKYSNKKLTLNANNIFNNTESLKLIEKIIED